MPALLRGQLERGRGGGGGGGGAGCDNPGCPFCTGRIAVPRSSDDDDGQPPAKRQRSERSERASPAARPAPAEPSLCYICYILAGLSSSPASPAPAASAEAAAAAAPASAASPAGFPADTPAEASDDDEGDDDDDGSDPDSSSSSSAESDSDGSDDSEEAAAVALSWVLLVVDVSEASLLWELHTHPALACLLAGKHSRYYTGITVLHLSRAHVQITPEYHEWVDAIGNDIRDRGGSDVKHLSLVPMAAARTLAAAGGAAAGTAQRLPAGDSAVTATVYRAATRLQLRLATLDPESYGLPHTNGLSRQQQQQQQEQQEVETEGNDRKHTTNIQWLDVGSSASIHSTSTTQCGSTSSGGNNEAAAAIPSLMARETFTAESVWEQVMHSLPLTVTVPVQSSGTGQQVEPSACAGGVTMHGGTRIRRPELRRCVTATAASKRLTDTPSSDAPEAKATPAAVGDAPAEQMADRRCLYELLKTQPAQKITAGAGAGEAAATAAGEAAAGAVAAGAGGEQEVSPFELTILGTGCKSPSRLRNCAP